MRRALAISGVFAGLLLASACAASPERIDGQATPVGAPSPAPSPSPSLSPAPSSSPSLSPSPSRSPSRSSSPTPSRTRTTATTLVLGPTGLGALKIGMTVSQAEKTGLIEDYDGNGQGCGGSVLTAAPDTGSVIHSADLGVIAIPAYGRVATPEGIRIGSTLAQVQAAYDDLTEGSVDETMASGTGRAWAGGDDGNKVRYRFHFRDSKVEEMMLEHENQDCYE